jgi:hypothetical protein
MGSMYDTARVMSRTLKLVGSIAEGLYELGEDVTMIEAVGEWAGERTRESEIHTVERVRQMVDELSRLYPLEALKPNFDAALDAGERVKKFLADCDFESLRTTEFGTSELNQYITTFVVRIVEVIQAVGERQEEMFSLRNLSSLISEQLVQQAPQAAIQYLFTLFENHLRDRISAGPEVYGESLINQAFGERGCLTYGPVKSEDLGVRNLMSGAYATFRNPSMHRLIEYDERLVTSVLVLVDLLIQLVDGASAKPPSSS